MNDFINLVNFLNNSHLWDLFVAIFAVYVTAFYFKIDKRITKIEILLMLIAKKIGLDNDITLK